MVDINPAAAHLIGQPINQLIGSHRSQTLTEWPELAAKYRDVGKSIEIQFETGIRYIYLNILPFYDKYSN
ncbi:MAG: hypothetical protein IPL78_36300 [Chloroflexi bacterium]|nr:hypothetical protein [Chloroflexota bacterium]